MQPTASAPVDAAGLSGSARIGVGQPNHPYPGARAGKPTLPLHRMPRRHSLGSSERRNRLQIMCIVWMFRTIAWSTRHGPPSSFQSDVRAPARASKTFGGLCLFSIHDRVPRRDSAEAASAINLATMDCAHFPRSNVVLENWGPPRGVDRSSIRFLRWQLVHQFGPLLLNHLSDIV